MEEKESEYYILVCKDENDPEKKRDKEIKVPGKFLRLSGILKDMMQNEKIPLENLEA